MEIEENSIYRCNFIRDLCERIKNIHNEVVQHEDSRPKCEICTEKKTDFTSIKNQLFILVQINIRLKNEQRDTTKDIERSTEDGQSANTDEKTSLSEPSQLISKLVDIDDRDDTDDETANSTNQAEQGRVESKNYNFQCALCDLRLSRKCHLALHMKTHLKRTKIPHRRNYQKGDKCENLQKCNLCEKVYRKRHDCSFGESASPSLFPCTHCPKVFKSYLKIYQHHKANHKDHPYPISPFQCEICGDFSLRMYTLKRHMQIHTDYAPFSCNICQRKFRAQHQLINHKRKHIPKAERDDTFKCDLCSKKFANGQTLKKHKRLKHTDNRELFQCDICGGNFITPTSLQKHQTVHDGRAPRVHKCDQCGRSFEKKKWLNQHRKKQHKIFTDLMLNPKSKKKSNICR
ncbi:hypothetical protein DMENIID0001_007700 [Sergentomyia squamirostris]